MTLPMLDLDIFPLGKKWDHPFIIGTSTYKVRKGFRVRKNVTQRKHMFCADLDLRVRNDRPLQKLRIALYCKDSRRLSEQTNHQFD